MLGYYWSKRDVNWPILGALAKHVSKTSKDRLDSSAIHRKLHENYIL